MKRTLTLLAATVLVMSLAPAAFATDGIGVYADEAGTINCGPAPTPYTITTLFVVAKNISSTSGLSGWECAVIYDPPSLPVPPTYTLRNGGLNVLTAPNFQVGMAVAMPYAPALTLASIDILYFSGSIKVGLGPCTPSSFGRFPYESVPPAPGFAEGDNPGVLHPLFTSSNTPSGTASFYWVYYMNVAEPCPGSPVGTEENSWSSVKNLFK